MHIHTYIHTHTHIYIYIAAALIFFTLARAWMLTPDLRELFCILLVFWVFFPKAWTISLACNVLLRCGMWCQKAIARKTFDHGVIIL